MYVTVAEYAAKRGVSPETIEWLISDADTRPISLGYVDVPPVFAAPGTFARLWGAGDMAVRYQIQRGVIPLREGGRVDVHEGDLAWGLAYWDRVQWPADLDAPELRVFMTIEMQAIERELIRLGHLAPEDRVERQLTCLVRSTKWWRRQQGVINGDASGRKAQQSEAERPGEVLLQPDCATKRSGGRPLNPILAKIMREEGCSRWTAYRILARRQAEAERVGDGTGATADTP